MTAATTAYCACDRPAIDVDVDDGCRRCGLSVDFTPPDPRVGVIQARLETAIAHTTPGGRLDLAVVELEQALATLRELNQEQAR